MSDSYATVLRHTKKIEAFLATEFGAKGRGLHAKVSSVGPQLPAPLVRRLRWLATLRNKLVHEDGFELHDPQGFERGARQAMEGLAALKRRAPHRGRSRRPHHGDRAVPRSPGRHQALALHVGYLAGAAISAPALGYPGYYWWSNGGSAATAIRQGLAAAGEVAATLVSGGPGSALAQVNGAAIGDGALLVGAATLLLGRRLRRYAPLWLLAGAASTLSAVYWP